MKWGTRMKPRHSSARSKLNGSSVRQRATAISRIAFAISAFVTLSACGNQIYYVFGLALLLVYLVLAGQYESWYAPIAVILAVPLSLLGPMAVLSGLRIENNLYTQIGLILLIALSAKNAILIVEVPLELHVRDRKPLLESAVEAARARFRPILMTSFAFILGNGKAAVASHTASGVVL